MSLILFFIVLAILILSHELGHFAVAKYFGVRVDEFGFGFPPRLFVKKRGETEYSLNLIPFGGFVKIFGEDETDEYLKTPEKDRSRSLLNQPKKVQAAVILAGVFCNFLLAWFLISTTITLGAKVSATSLPERLKASEVGLVVMNVVPGSPADKAGLKSGDEVVYVASIERTLQEGSLAVKNVQDLIASSKDKDIVIGFSRDRAPAQSIIVTPVSGIVEDRGAIGVSLDMVGTLKLPFYRSIYEGFIITIRLVAEMVVGLVDFVYGFFVGSSSVGQVSGPVGMVGIVGEAGRRGIVELLNMTALISINLAVINLVPFPALDGGRLLFLVVESLRGKPINKKATATMNAIGFLLLLSLMFAVTYSDISKIFFK
ncbi:MAG TPA: RIP metalloprotease RseP [Candidatus Paceibacterota bacterium]|nr:RIP metalloprotease RseP [Candidatus Paceibacterota bacterium]